MELYKFIKNLTGPEKSYYKKIGKRHANNNRALHIQLFDIISSARADDDKVFAAQLGVKSSAHYSALKRYLWDDLLDSLVYFGRSGEVTQMSFLILQFEILIDKNLVRSASRLLERAYGLAEKNELYKDQLHLLQHKYRILSYANYKRYHTGSMQLLKEQRSLLDNIHVQQELTIRIRELLSIKKFAYMRPSPEQMDRVEMIMREVATIQLSEAQPLLSLAKNIALCMANHISFHFEAADRYASEVEKLWTQNTNLISRNVDLFLDSVEFSIYNYFALKKNRLAEEKIELYDRIAADYLKSNRVNNTHWMALRFNTLLKVYYKTAQFEKLATHMKGSAEETIALSKDVLPPSVYISLMASAAIAYFLLEDYKRSEALLVDVINVNYEVQRDDMLYFCSIFQLVLFYEQKDYYRLTHAVNAVYLKLYNKKKLHSFERDVLPFFKNLNTVRSKKEVNDIMRQFLEKLTIYRNDPVKEMYFFYFNYYGWIESKIKGIRYTDYVKLQLTSAA